MIERYTIIRKIAVISNHASSLAVVGGIDSGGQNITVAELTQHLTQLCYQVDVFTRWDDMETSEVVTTDIRAFEWYTAVLY